MKPSGVKAVAAACVALLAACSDTTGPRDAAAELERALVRWNARAIDDYRMTIRLHGGWLGGAAIVTVRDGEPASVQPIAPWEGLPPQAFQSFDTVQELFAILRRAVDQDADEIDARYHRQLGVPVEVFIDPMKHAIDEEHGFVVESFQVL